MECFPNESVVSDSDMRLVETIAKQIYMTDIELDEGYIPEEAIEMVSVWKICL